MVSIETPVSRPRRRGRPAPDAAPVADDKALLDAAFETFAERGYEGAAIRDIARRLNVSHNLIHFRFGSKESLWRRAVDHAFGQSVEVVFPAFDAPTTNTREALNALVTSFCLFSWRQPGLIGLMNLEGRRASWRLDYLYAAYVEPFKARLDHMLNMIAAGHGVRRVPTNAFMVLLIHGAGNLFAMRPLMDLAGEGLVSEGEVLRQAEVLVDLLLPALNLPLESPQGEASA